MNFKTCILGMSALTISIAACQMTSGKPAGSPAAPAQAIAGEIRALWTSPSHEFIQATEMLNREPRELSITKLRGVISASGSATEKAAASYALAGLLKGGSREEKLEALQIYESMSQPGHPLHALLRREAFNHQTGILQGLGMETELRSLLERAAGAGASIGDRQKAQYELGQSYMRSREYSQAKPIFENLQKPEGQKNNAVGAETNNWATAANYYLAQIALADTTDGAPSQEARNQAVQYLRAYIKSQANGRFSRDAAKHLRDLVGSADALSSEDNDALFAIYYKSGDYAEALACINRGAHFTAFQKAYCLFKTGARSEAQAEYLRALAANKDAKNYAEIADIITGPMTRAETLAYWRKIAAIGPQKADAAMWNIASRTTDQEADTLYRKIAQEHPTSQYAPESCWWYFWHGLKPLYPSGLASNKTRAKQLADFAEATARQYPGHRSAARFLYWRGKIYEAIGEPAAAQLSYEAANRNQAINYYAGRARQRLAYLRVPKEKRSAATDRAWSIQASRPASLSQWDWPRAGELFDMERVARECGAKVAVLAVTKQCAEALTALSSEPAGGHKDLDGFKAWLNLQQNQVMDGIRAAGRNLDGTPEKSKMALWQIDYPWAYAGAIKQEAEANKVDPFLVHALIREESRYNPRALSRSNAIGLMQLLPGTGYGVAKRLGVPLSSKEDIFVPEINIKLGTNYLAYTLSRFASVPHANAMLAVASYNGGPNAVKRWNDEFRAQGKTDYDVFVEDIPFRETRDYVRKVFGSYYNYQLLYPG